MQVALRSKISELETVEAEEKETLKATKKAVREVQRILSNKDLSMETKLDQFQQKYLQQVPHSSQLYSKCNHQVNDQMKVEKTHFQTQKKLDKVTAEKIASMHSDVTFDVTFVFSCGRGSSFVIDEFEVAGFMSYASKSE